MRRISSKSNVFLLLTILYIYIPVVIFLLGFTKWYIGIPTAIISTVFAYKMYASFKEDNREREDVTISVPVFVTAITFIVIVCILCGICGLYPQAGDWYKHNAVLHDLVNYPWPIYYSSRETCMLTYYLGQYMIPGLLGKIFNNFWVANFAMAIWAFVGLALVYLQLIRIVKAESSLKQLITAVVLLFFCGAVVLAQNLLGGIYGDASYCEGSYHWILVKSIMVQYRSNLVMLRWVFPQVIVPWLVSMLIYEHRQHLEHYVALILPTLLFASFSFAALGAVGVMLAIYQCVMNKDEIKAWCKKLLSVSNILMALSLGLILFFYFLGNIQVDKPLSSSFRLQKYNSSTIWIYVIFCFFTFGIYALCTWKEHRKEELFYINVLILLALPFMRMGLCNDVVMSGSIPSLFFIMIFCLRVLFNHPESGIRQGIIIFCMCVGAFYPCMELRDNIIANREGMDMGDEFFTMEQFTDREDDEISEDLVYNYYTYDMKGKFFYEHIARFKLSSYYD